MGRNSSGGRGDDVALTREAVRLQFELWQVDDKQDEWGRSGFYIKALRIKPPATPGGEWFCATTVSHQGADLVGFTSAPDLVGLLHLVLARLLNGSMKWQEDKYATR